MKTIIVLKLEIKGYHSFYINQYIYNLQKIANKLFMTNFNQVSLPSKIERFTVLKSPHVDKKAREQFERITHRRFLNIKILLKGLNSEWFSLFYFLRLIQNLGVSVEVNLNYKIYSV